MSLEAEQASVTSIWKCACDAYDTYSRRSCTTHMQSCEAAPACTLYCFPCGGVARALSAYACVIQEVYPKGLLQWKDPSYHETCGPCRPLARTH